MEDNIKVNLHDKDEEQIGEYKVEQKKRKLLRTTFRHKKRENI